MSPEVTFCIAYWIQASVSTWQLNSLISGGWPCTTLHQVIDQIATGLAVEIGAIASVIVVAPADSQHLGPSSLSHTGFLIMTHKAPHVLVLSFYICHMYHGNINYVVYIYIIKYALIESASFWFTILIMTHHPYCSDIVKCWSIIWLVYRPLSETVFWRFCLQLVWSAQAVKRQLPLLPLATSNKLRIKLLLLGYKKHLGSEMSQCHCRRLEPRGWPGDIGGCTFLCMWKKDCSAYQQNNGLFSKPFKRKIMSQEEKQFAFG